MELPERCGVPSPDILQLADPISRRREGSGDILAVCPGGFQLPQFILESAQLVLEAVAMAVERLGAISGHEMPDGIAGAAQRGVLEFRVLLYPAWSVGCEFVNALFPPLLPCSRHTVLCAAEPPDQVPQQPSDAGAERDADRPANRDQQPYDDAPDGRTCGRERRAIGQPVAQRGEGH